MVSLKNVAEKCGVSTATVSKALNGAKDISMATRDRVRKAAEEMGYRPNAAARSLKTNRSYNIGVLFMDESSSGLQNEYFAGMLESFKREANTSGYDITFISRDVGNRNMSYYNHCIYNNMDGAAIVCAQFQDPDILELVNSELAVVTIDHIFDNRMSVSSDNLLGMKELVNYVCNMGHRRVAYITGAPSSVSQTRLRAFYIGMEEHGIKVRDEYVKEGIFHDTVSCEKITEELLALKEPPTCILFPDDFSAIGGLNKIKELGLRIPEDISVAGYDGIQLSRVLAPALTTLHQDNMEMGKVAARQLISLIEHPMNTIPTSVKVPGCLWEGGSVNRI